MRLEVFVQDSKASYALIVEKDSHHYEIVQRGNAVLIIKEDGQSFLIKESDLYDLIKQGDSDGIQV